MNAPNEILLEGPCYYLTPEYAKSFWGSFVSLYQGRGRLRLTHETLSFEAEKLSFDILVNTIAHIEAGVFSRFAKPFGLAFIKLCYLRNDKENIVLLIPAKSAFAPTWKTNELTATWLETMGRINELSNRIKQPLNIPAPPTRLQLVLAFLLLLAIDALIVGICGVLYFWIWMMLRSVGLY